MGKRGPRPTPTEILKLRGSTLVTNRRDQTEVRGPAGKPTCPSWLDANAKSAWRQLVPMLDGMGVLSRVDRDALTLYCRLWSRWRKAEAFLESKGEVYTIKDEQGRVKCVMPFPQVSIANELVQQLIRLEQEFGMTPSARSRIQVERPYVQSATSAKYFS